MKTCPVCALDLEDTYLFCPDDGSSLGTQSSNETAGRSIESKPKAAGESDLETATGPVVLYCPMCAAEYPLTFSACPVHGVRLTKHPIPRLSNRQPEPGAFVENVSEQAASGLTHKQHEFKFANQLTSLNLERPRIDGPRRMIVGLPESSEPEANDDASEGHSPQLTAMESISDHESELNSSATLAGTIEQSLERPGLRIAAIAIVIALGLFALVALYTVISNLSRRPSSPVARDISEAGSAPFIPTPQAAQDYKDEQPAPEIKLAAVKQVEAPVDKKRIENPSSSPYVSRNAPVVTPAPKTLPTPTPTPVRMGKAAMSPALELPRGNAAGFDSRLVRVRGRKTPSGFRYDLTFNMQEQAGRSAQWQRVLISTRSASGIGHSESIPFAHLLGATGALTFTISVELAGRSEPDWEGRVVCTALGWDNKGAPLQASFGTSVKPY